ncbi:TPA: hypothetical protein U2D44_000147 [Streptococcus suis]|nr:hypothetical protein [Streptococcus suis]HEM6430879.1 hypothetical protein [Streptococcus suis]
MNIFQMLFTLMAVALVIYALIKGFQFLMIQMAKKNDKAVVWIQFHSVALPDIQSTKDYELVFKGKQYYSFLSAMNGQQLLNHIQNHYQLGDKEVSVVKPPFFLMPW